MRHLSITPPAIAMTISDPPIFVFGPSPFNPSAKMVGGHQRHKEAVEEHRPHSHPAWVKNTERDQHDIHHRVCSQESVRRDESH